MEAEVGVATAEEVVGAMVVDLAAEATAVAGSAADTWVAAATLVAAIWVAALMVAVIRWVAGRWAVCLAGDSAGMPEVARSIARPMPVVVR